MNDADDFPECEPCGLRSEDVTTCDHLLTACPDCTYEGACALCQREAIEERDYDIREGFEREDGAA